VQHPHRRWEQAGDGEGGTGSGRQRGHGQPRGECNEDIDAFIPGESAFFRGRTVAKIILLVNCS
jgi:hypothetical protein